MLNRSVTPLVYSLSVKIQDRYIDSLIVNNTLSDYGRNYSRNSLQRKVYFNLFLVEYLMSHLQSLWLDDVSIKRFDDEWLVTSHLPDDLAGMSCLGLILSKSFKAELAAVTGISPENLPELRLCLTAAKARRVDLIGGRHEWIVEKDVGTRAQASKVNGNDYSNGSGNVEIDETVCVSIKNTFQVRLHDSLNGDNRPSFFVLDGIQDEVVDAIFGVDGKSDLDDYEVNSNIERFIYTLTKTEDLSGTQLAEMKSIVLTNAEEIICRAPNSEASKRVNTLIDSFSDYVFAKKLTNTLHDLKEPKIKPDARTYELLIGLSPDYDTALNMLDKTDGDGVML
ncbi:MAG: hypothetical protein HY779_03840, partial [Rubrobacteridae bacterium]|nr:hypothetical protein [Rubrobacteridae bacterium]